MTEFLALLKEGGYGVAAIVLAGLVWMYLSKESMREKMEEKHAANVAAMREKYDKEIADLRTQITTMAREQAGETKASNDKRFGDFEKIMTIVTGFEQGRTALVQSNRDLVEVISQMKDRLFKITAGGAA